MMDAVDYQALIEECRLTFSDEAALQLAVHLSGQDN